MSSPQIVKWLKSHPLISVRGLETLTGLPNDTIRQAMEGKRNIPQKHIPAIVLKLRDYGF